MPDIVISEHLQLDIRLLVASEGYHHILSKKKASDSLTETEKLLPIDTLGLVMIGHGEEFGPDSSFGEFLRDRPQQNDCTEKKNDEISRTCTRETGTGPLQSSYVTRGVCVDIERHFSCLDGSVQGRYQRMRDSQEETR